MKDEREHDVRDLPNEGVVNRTTERTDMVRKEERNFGDNSVGEEEPGPYDDDGLPENARRRVPS